MTVDLEFLDDPEAFLDAAGALLAASPVESTVVASVTARLVADPEAVGGDVPRWWLVVRDGDRPVVERANLVLA
ncbi:hypothetical protein [Nocardioides pocheonensis]|uniref:Uncharacterized protein n=1 Tax=Nocardioides pocheonensis TaxID=661485 RepID=A0A3N0GMZ1_9ACTN|nr:hypothetical protein [Nocardioides pocheonensis]RNM13769.1 hypothetical protein EFL26_12410 [Nocardioides pocheonensis]